jgi:hypothetical protein
MPVITLKLDIPERIFGVSYFLKFLFLSLLEQLILCYNAAFIAGPTYNRQVRTLWYQTHFYHSTYYILLFINDLQLNIQGANLVLFVDDTNFFIIAKNESALQYKIKMLQSNRELGFREITL